MKSFILSFFYFEIICQDYLYDLNYIYYPDEFTSCINGVCGINFDLGGKTQIFPFSMFRFFNPNFMACGLSFKILKVSQLDKNDNEITAYTANLDNPERLLYGQDTVYNYTYCNPQIETTSTSSTAFPFGTPVTNTFDAYYYPQLNCTPVNAVLSSSQVYLTNGTLLDFTFGVLNIDVSFFTQYGYMVNQARNQSQFVRPGDIWINFTLSRIEWAVVNNSVDSKQIAEKIRITFMVGGSDEADLLDVNSETYGCNNAYDVGSGTAILFGIGMLNEEIIRSLPVYKGTNAAKTQNYFHIDIRKFDGQWVYGGVYLFQDKLATCQNSIVGSPGPGGSGKECI